MDGADDQNAVERGNLLYSYFGDAQGQYTNGVFSARTLQADMGNYESLGNSLYLDWALNRRCSSITALIGIDDDSAATTKFRVEVFVDGVSAYLRDFVLGQSESLNLPVQNALRVRTKATKTAALTNDCWFNFGDLPALCLP